MDIGQPFEPNRLSPDHCILRSGSDHPGLCVDDGGSDILRQIEFWVLTGHSCNVSAHDSRRQDRVHNISKSNETMSTSRSTISLLRNFHLKLPSIDSSP